MLFNAVFHVIPVKAFVLSYAVFRGFFILLGGIIYYSTGAKADQPASRLLSVIDYPVPSFFIPSTWLRERSSLVFVVLNAVNGLYFLLWILFIVTLVARDMF